jgi:D-alanine-D-alanine ligase
MTIAILYGGKSGEHEISLISAASIARGIDASKHQIILIGITKDGRWFLQDYSELARIRRDTKSPLKITEDPFRAVSILPGGGIKKAVIVGGKSIPVDVVFPALHGTFGEDGTVQGMLEMAELPYVGCGVMTSAVTMDKEKTKAVWENAGLPVVPYVCVRRSDLTDSKKYDKFLDNTVAKLSFPLFVKPCSAGSSDGAAKATNMKELNGALTDAFHWGDKVLIEKAINAREVECSVTGNATTDGGKDKAEAVTAYIPGEIAPTHTFYDYDAKYNDPNGAALKIPADLDKKMLETVRTTAVAAYKALDASGLSRVDFFVDRDSGTLYLNEINTIPGFTSISMFPKLCEAAGLTFTELTELLLQEAVLRFKATRSLQTSRTDE